MQSFEVFFDVRLKHLLKKNNRFFGEFIPYVHDARLTSLLCLIDCLEWVLRNHISLDMRYNRALWFGQVSPHMSKLHIMCLTKWLGRQEFCFCTPITTTTPTHEWYFFVQGTLRNHISDVTRKKKLGLTTNFGNFSKWPPEIFNISEITSCRIMICGSKPIFSWPRIQINTLYSLTANQYVCKRTKHENIQDGRNFALYFGKCVITSVLVAINRWVWCLNLSFHVWGFQ